MQIDINPDVSEYKETIYFGMTIRQCVCCVLGAAPFAFMGFFSYHGMTAEQFLWNFICTMILTPRVLYRDPPEQLDKKEDDHAQND